MCYIMNRRCAAMRSSSLKYHLLELVVTQSRIGTYVKKHAELSAEKLRMLFYCEMGGKD